MRRGFIRRITGKNDVRSAISVYSRDEIRATTLEDFVQSVEKRDALIANCFEKLPQLSSNEGLQLPQQIDDKLTFCGLNVGEQKERSAGSGGLGL